MTLIERVARALQDRDKSFSPGEALDPAFLDDARAAITAIPQDPDIAEILRWLDFKSCGWHPDEQTYRGARKLLEAFGTNAALSEKTP